jgi:hypothetical protein
MLRFSITGGNDNDAFAVHETTGELTVTGNVVLDFEGPTNAYSLIVTATDDGHPSRSNTATVDIHVANVNEPPQIGMMAGGEIVFTGLTILENVAGYQVGSLATKDPEGDAQHLELVGSTIFELTGDQLWLKNDAYVRRASAESEDSVSITVRATDVNDPNVRIDVDLPLNIVDNPTPARNPFNHRDVNGDGSVAPSDALAVVNHLNSGESNDMSVLYVIRGERIYYLDVDGNRLATPFDVLNIINFLNGVESEGEATIPWAGQLPMHHSTAREVDRQQPAVAEAREIAFRQVDGWLREPSLATQIDGRSRDEVRPGAPELEEIMDELLRTGWDT